MLTDAQILNGLFGIVRKDHITPEKLREMGVHATVGFLKPKFRTHWVRLPHHDPEGSLWIGMPRKQLERCVILGGFPSFPKPTLGRVLRTVGRQAAYAYENFSRRREITRGRKETSFSQTTRTKITQTQDGILFEDIELGDPPERVPNHARVSIPDTHSLSLSIPILGPNPITLHDHLHRPIDNPFKAGKSDMD